MKRVLHLLFCLMLLLTSLPAFTAQLPKTIPLDKVRLQLKWSHQFQFAGYYAAKQQGYYAQEGLDVEILVRNFEKKPVKQVVSGEVDFAIGDIGILNDYAHGEPVIALAAIFQHNPIVFISKQSSGIIGPYEMLDKRIMIDSSDGSDIVLHGLLAQAGLDKKYTVVPHTYHKESLFSNNVDVSSIYLTVEAFYFQQKNIKINIINPQNYGIDFYSNILFTSNQQISTHPERVEKFRRASLKGWQYALAHPEQIIQLIHTHYHSQSNLENLRFEAKETAKLILPNQIPLGQIEIKRLQKVAEVYTQLDLARVLTERDLAKFIYTLQRLNLTSQEQAWLKKHPVIRVGIHNDLAPYEWVNKDGSYNGLAAEYMRLFQRRLGVRFSFITRKTRAEIMAMVRARQLDMLARVSITPERGAFLSFTAPYVSNPVVIFNRENSGFIGYLSQLNDKKVAVEKGSYIEELLTRDYPKIQLLLTPNNKSALQKVADGDAVAYVGDAVAANYAIAQLGISNLHFSGNTEYSSAYAVGVAQFNPELASIMKKLMATISVEERQHINHYWMSLKAISGISQKILIRYAVVFLTVLLFFVAWVFQLRREITKRKKVEQQLSILSIAIEQSPASVIITDLQSNIIYVNPAFIDITGYSAKEVLGKTPQILKSDLSCQQTYEQLFSNLNNGIPWHGELSSRRKNGEIYYEETHFAPVKNSAGATTHFVGVKLDITQRKLAEQALRYSESRLKAIYNAGNDAFFLVQDGVCVDCNPAGLKMFGCTSLAEIILKKPSDFSPPTQPCGTSSELLAREKIAYAMKHGSCRFEWQHKKYQTDETFSTDVVLSLLVIDGKTLIQSVIRNMTAYKKIEQQLIHNQKFTESILNSLSAHIAVLDADGNITAVNQAWKNFAQENNLKNENNCIGCNYFTVCTSDSESKADQETINIMHGIRAVLKGEQAFFDAEYPCHSPTEQRWFYMTATPLQIEKGGAVISHQNITQPKLAEQALKDSEAQFRSMFEIMPVPLLLADAEFRVSYINSTFIETFGYNLADIPTIEEWWPKAYPDQIYRELMISDWQMIPRLAGQEGLKSPALEVNVCCKDGVQKTVLISETAVFQGGSQFYLIAFYDISDRKKIENEVLATKIQLQATLDAIPDLLFDIDLEGYFYNYHAKHHETLVVSPEQFIGKKVSETMPPDMANVIMSALQEAEQSYYSNGKQFALVQPQGELWFELSVAKKQTDLETQSRFIVLSRDITKRKQTEDALRNSQQKYYSLVNDMGDKFVVYSHTLDGELTYLSKGITALSGIPQEQAIGQNWVNILNWLPGGVDLAQSYINQIIEKQIDFVQFEMSYQHQDNTVHTLQISAHASRDENGTVLSMDGLAEDMTERKQMETALRQSEKRLQEIIDLMPVAVFVKDPQSHIMIMNKACEAQWGFSFSQVANTTASDFFPPEQIVCFLTADRKVFNSGNVIELEEEVWNSQLQASRITHTYKKPIFSEAGQPEYLIGISVDITESRQREDLLKASEAQFRLMMDISPVPSMLVENDQIIFINPAITNIFGYSSTDFSSFSEAWAKAYPNPEYRKWVTNNFYIDLETENRKFTPLEVTIRCKNGIDKIVLASATKLSKSANTLLILLYDVTDHRQGELELAKNKRFSALIEAIPDAVFFKDAAGRWLITNKAAKDLFQLHNILWQGKTGAELIEMQPEFRKMHEKCFQDDEITWSAGKLTLFSESVMTKDNQKLDFEVRKVPIFDEKNQKQALVIISRDVSEKNRMEEQIHKLAQAIEQNPQSIIITNLNTQIEYVNSAFVSITGYQRDEVYGKNPNIFASGKTPPETYVDLWQTLKQGQTWKGEFINRRKDGSEYIAFAFISPLRDSTGNISHYLAIREDITEKKRLGQELDSYRYHLEEQVQQRTHEAELARVEADRANTAKSDFLANMSHEIRTPMNAIMGMSYLISQTKLDRRQQELMKKIQSSSQHLLSILNDILDFSKIEAGKLNVEHTEFEMEKVLDNVAALMIQKASLKSLELIFNVDPLIPSYLIGDPMRLGQVLINYVSNAIKFTEQGHIILELRLIEENPKDILLYFAISDTGIGLTEEQRLLLFQSFQQADMSITRKYGGTGLGLVISKRLAELMGGKVGVSSQYGQGSTFWFTARLHKSAKQTRKLVVQRNLCGRKMLVVDDNERVREIICCQLNSMSFLAETADSGEMAVAAIKRAAIEQKPYEIIFLDWQMPQIDGLETAQQILALNLDKMPHLVMLTSFNQDTLSKQAQSVKIAKILNKPVSTSSLFDTAIKLLSDEYVQFIPTVVPESSHSIQGAQVLLVEDNGLNQEVGVELLKEVGVWADVAENGAIALQKIQEKNYDLVLMDIQMPVMDGVTATIEIRKLPQFADLPIVAMTANAMRQDREHCLAVGMNDHLAKPIEPQDLWAMLHKWIKPRLFNFSAEKVKKESSDTMTIPNDIAGLDTTLGLRRMAGKQELYVSMLKKFVDNQKSAIENIQTALAENDLITAERLAHTLKGLAGNIGAVSLQKQTEQLELALHSHAADEKLNPILANVALSLAQLIAALKLQFEPTANTRIDTPMLTQEIDQAILQKVVVELINLLADDDAEAVNYFAKNEKLLHGVFPIQFKLLQKWVCNYDFVDALNTLKQAAVQKQII